MKAIQFALLIFLVFFCQHVIAQRTQTIRSTASRVQVETLADSTLVFLFPGLVDAEITLKNGRTNPAKINYNILLDRMEIQTRGSIFQLETNNLERIKAEGSTFVFRTGKGFFEVLSGSSLPLYLKREIRVTAQPVRRGAYGGNDRASSIEVLSNFSVSDGNFGQTITLDNPGGQELEITLRYNEYFVLEKGNQLIRLTNARQLQRDFPEYSHGLRDFMRHENINLSNRNDLLKLVKFLESQ